MLQFICYPKCSTCQKAKKWLEAKGIDFETRHIVEQNPGAEEIMHYSEISGLPLKKFVNTSGILYRQMELKDKFSQLDDKGKCEILASNGMLVKRPLLIGADFVLVGFKETEWEKKFN